MTEAFEIGITLALDNGVSAGITAIRRDLDALDRAIASSASGLLALHRLSASLAAGAPTYPSVPAAASQPMPGPTEAVPEAGPPAPANAVFLPVPEPTLAMRPAPPAYAPIVSDPPAPPPGTVSSTPVPLSPPQTLPPAPSPMTHLAPPPAAPTTLPTVEATPPATVLTHTLPHPLADHGPAEPLTRATAAISPRTKPLPPQPIAVRQPLPPIQPRILPAITEPPSRQPQTIPLRMSAPRNQFSSVPADRTLAAASVAPMAPVSLATRPAQPPPSQFPAFPPHEPGLSRSRSASPPHGEIILDGARLGRWIADRLSRAVDRPQSGITGFDPRVSPLYAGAPNGS